MFPMGATALVAPYGQSGTHGSGFIKPVQFSTQRRRAEIPDTAQLAQQEVTDEMWNQYKKLARSSYNPVNKVAAATAATTSQPISTPNGTSSLHPLQPPTSPALPTSPPKQPPSPIERGDLPKVTAGVVMTATEGLTLPLSAAAAILDKFGTAVAVPFPGMGAAIARAAGVLGGAAESANKMAPTMAPLLADTLEEVWKQAAKAEKQSATSVSRWVDFSNGVNVFEVTAEGDGAQEGTGKRERGGTGGQEKTGGQDEDVTDHRVRAQGHGETGGQDEENKPAVNVPGWESSKNEHDEAADRAAIGAASAAEPGMRGDQSRGEETVTRAGQSAESLKSRWENVNWTQFLLNRRQTQAVQPVQGIAARSLDLFD